MMTKHSLIWPNEGFNLDNDSQNDEDEQQLDDQSEIRLYSTKLSNLTKIKFLWIFYLRKSWSEVIRHDLKTLGLVEDMAQDRKLWRDRIKVTDF